MGSLVTLRVAMRALAKNKMRAALTILGVVIGIASVTTMVSLGQSATDMVQGEFQSFGTNIVMVFPGGGGRGGPRGRSNANPTLTDADCDAIVDECPSVLDASPYLGTSGQLVYGNTNWSSRELLGVGPGYLVVRNWPVDRGVFISDRDITSANQVCVIGRKVARELFQTMNPIGETIRIRNIPFRVIGMFEEKGANLVGEDQDDIVVLPYTTVRQRLNQSRFKNVHAIFASARTPDLMDDAEREINQLLLERHQIAPGLPADFSVQNTEQFANALGNVTGILTMLLASIAAISLLVGGVGIMNIMLVSVTERTREIGIRMAVGARGGDILRQFLVESIVLSVIGGMLGFALGCVFSVGATMLINEFSATKWPVTISMTAGIVAVVFSALVGMFFGFYPARRASRLDPIDALRYE